MKTSAGCCVCLGSPPIFIGKGLPQMKIATYVKSTLAASALVLAVSALSVTAYAESSFYQVVNVKSNDSLNIRSGAGTGYPVISTIPFNGRTVMSTGQTQRVGRSTWVEVVWLGQIGWVNKRFLVNSSQIARTRQPAPMPTPMPIQNNANRHTHPANRCTRSVTHSHPNGANPHKHHYSCDSNTRQQRPVRKNNQTAYPRQSTDPNAHTHPRNECTNSITHTHPNGARAHQHRYSCQRNAQPKYRRPKPTTNNYYAIQ